MVKRLNVLIPDELHKKLRIALAANETNYSKWVRGHIEKYVEEAEKKSISDFGEMTSGMWSQIVQKSVAQEEAKSRKKKNPRGKKKA
jgi:predicted DNA-binding protein